MTKKPSTVTVGKIHDISGSVNVAGGNIGISTKISIHNSADIETITAALATALAKTKKRPKTTPVQKADIEKEVKEIEAEMEKKKANTGFLTKRFQNIAKMAPDILEVIIAGLGNPATGLALTMKKIAEKAKAETKTEAVAK